MRGLFEDYNYNYNVKALEEAVNPYELEAQITKYDDFTVDAMDKLLNDQVQIAHNFTTQHAIVKSRKRDAYGKPICKSHLNVFLDKRWYEVDFLDRTVK